MAGSATTRDRLKLAAASLGLAALVAGCLWLIAHSFIAQANRQQLNDMLQAAVVRLERQIDLAVISMGELGAQGPYGCSPTVSKAIEDIAFRSVSIREIRVSSPRGTCWADNAHEATFSAALEAANPLPAVNPAYEFAPIEAGEWKGLMVRWTNDDGALTAFLATSGLLFDILPAELREHARMEMSLNDQRVVSSYQPEGSPEMQGDFAEFGTASERYPIRVRLMIDEAVVDSWNNRISSDLIAIAGLFSLSLGYLGARGLTRQQTPLAQLDDALVRGHIHPVYQPLFCLATGEMTGFEMLARWTKPDGSSVSPAVFIPLAEASKRIDKLTFALLDKAGAEIGEMLRHNAKLKLSFNVTPDQLLDPLFIEHFVAKISQANLNPSQLVIEITERQPISDIQAALRVSRELSELGVRLALDDAGTGHNGLSSLHALQAHYLKIDKYFVDGVVLDRKSSALVEALISLAKQFGMEVVAEGIETEEQRIKLLDLGIREGQGYLFAKPLSASDLIARSEQNPSLMPQAA
ncbi:EAL domain-containing protein [Rhizobium rosettiformans W3]|uniref:EAL domain-containing protein n=1 Tax=Rhizobium rosettiformans W3 TaxID=538378 RepID=A0A4S8Q0R7_9HYPH|nr:EAL domain-containing protein [Rhizobium rosettiformans W3]